MEWRCIHTVPGGDSCRHLERSLRHSGETVVWRLQGKWPEPPSTVIAAVCTLAGAGAAALSAKRAAKQVPPWTVRDGDRDGSVGKPAQASGRGATMAADVLPAGLDSAPHLDAKDLMAIDKQLNRAEKKFNAPKEVIIKDVIEMLQELSDKGFIEE